MERRSYHGWVVMILVTGLLESSSSLQTTKSTVFRFPRFELEPGAVINRFFYDIDFPRGHIGVKSLSAEVVDDSGNSVPLTEAYVHHWTASAYRVTSQGFMANGSSEGRCLTNYLGKSFGLGSETRRTRSQLPDPYAVETGKFDERWALSVHVIDTRGVADRLGCTECRCDLYNVTGEDLIWTGYKGGLYCCYDQSQCRLSHESGGGGKRGLFLRYNVTWIDWSDSLLPVSVFVMDITDEYYSEPVFNGTRSHNCHVEYDIVQSCNASNKCVETRRNKMSVLKGGYVVYAVSHQHAGGLGTTLYKEDGKVVCKSNPIYGRGKKAGNEAGYVVGMTACYPKPGLVKIREGEALVYESSYGSRRNHTGVMSLFYVVVADRLPNSTATPMGTMFI